MTEQCTRDPQIPNYDGTTDQNGLLELVQYLWRDRAFLGVLTGLAALASILVALWLPNVYQASVLLRPQSAEGGLGGLASQFGGLASLAGVSLPSGNEESKTQLALEVIKSKKFASNFVNRHEILPELMAADTWSWETETLTLDASAYDTSSQQWIRNVSPPHEPTPSAEEIHKFWNSNFLSVSQDKKSSFVTLSLKHRSPICAKKWLDLLVADINEALRTEDLAESERAVAYLERELKKTNIAEIRELLAGLLRSHMESRMMATVEPNYAFSVIDPPTVPMRRVAPRRTLICIVGTLLGAMIALVLSLVRREFSDRAEARE